MMAARKKEATLWLRPVGTNGEGYGQWLVLSGNGVTLMDAIDGAEDGDRFEAKVVMMKPCELESLGEHEGW